MFTQQNPALLIDERWIWLPIFSGRDKDSIVVDLDDLIPWNEFVWPAHTVFDVESHGLGKRLYQLKNQIRYFPNLPPEVPGADPPVEQLRKIEKLVVLDGG